MILLKKNAIFFRKSFDYLHYLCYIIRLAGVACAVSACGRAHDSGSWRGRQIFGKWLMLNCLPGIWRLRGAQGNVINSRTAGNGEDPKKHPLLASVIFLENCGFAQQSEVFQPSGSGEKCF